MDLPHCTNTRHMIVRTDAIIKTQKLVSQEMTRFWPKRITHTLTHFFIVESAPVHSTDHHDDGGPNIQHVNSTEGHLSFLCSAGISSIHMYISNLNH